MTEHTCITLCIRYGTAQRFFFFFQELEDGSVNSEAWQMLKAAELKRELVILDEAESRVLGQLQSLLAEKAQIIEKKRGHRQCLVNLVACYKKRK